MPTFRVINPNTDHNRVKYNAGDLIASDDDLAGKFPDKFQAIGGNSGPVEVKQDVPAGQQLASSMEAINLNIKTADNAPVSDAPELDDVSADDSWAEVAAKNAITIKHSSKTIAKGGGYVLFDGETQINEVGLAKGKVPAAITDYVK